MELVTRVARFAWGVLLYNLGVIAWGAYVRATRSGAGCGAHWPLCNGEVLPQSRSAEMLVEFTHRVSSGLALLAVVALLVWVWRAVPRGDRARRTAGWAMFFMLTEAGVGAALVLFRLVADNPSMARALFMSVHLANTFLLVASLALTAYWLSAGPGRAEGERNAAPAGGERRALPLARHLAGAAALMLAGISGAVAALGDTLFPSGSLSEALAADLSPASHLLIRLRIFHPGIAIGAAVIAILLGLRSAFEGRGLPRGLGLAVALLACVQVVAGFVNLLLLAPVWMQMIHLLIADALWVAFVLLAVAPAESTAEPAAPVASSPR